MQENAIFVYGRGGGSPFDRQEVQVHLAHHWDFRTVGSMRPEW
jgi:hypothetical protein